jgi:hypothetical protein
MKCRKNHFTGKGEAKTRGTGNIAGSHLASAARPEYSGKGQLKKENIAKVMQDAFLARSKKETAHNG